MAVATFFDFRADRSLFIRDMNSPIRSCLYTAWHLFLPAGPTVARREYSYQTFQGLFYWTLRSLDGTREAGTQ